MNITGLYKLKAINQSIYKNMFWPLMKSAITESDKIKLIEFIASTDKFTCGEKVAEFEKNWCEWLACKHSLFVTSGSTANILLLSAVKELYKIPNGSKVLVPACTWVTNVAPVFQLGLEPVFCDINLKDYSFDTENLPNDDDIKIVFVTHLLGFNAPMDKLKEKYPKAIFLEDICESHGIKEPSGRKRGHGTGSTFSFYFGHHMTTIEGGMVCTNNTELYELMRLKRNHGCARHLLPENYDKVTSQYPDINPAFLFLTDGYNFKNTEITAVVGIAQLKRLDENIQIRKDNYEYFIKKLIHYEDYFHIPDTSSSNSSYAFPIICKNKDNRPGVIKGLNDLGVEHRPIVSGNLLKHPFLHKWKDTCTAPNADILHYNGVYVGNSQFVTKYMIERLFTSVIESLKL